MAVSTRKSSIPGSSVTIVGAIVNSFLILIKFAAGVFGQSQALIMDAVHSVSDLFTDVVVLVGLKMGKKPPDTDHPFGHGRIETLSSAAIGLALIATALYLGIGAALNIYRGVEYHPTKMALIGAGLSIALKEALYHYTVHTGRRIKSQLVVANAWHHRSDALSSVAVFLGVGGAYLKPSWHVLDSFAALLVSFFIVKVGLEIARNTLWEFIDTAPKKEILNRIKKCALTVDGVVDTHDLKVRTSGGLYKMEIHIVVNGQLTVIEGHRIAKIVERRLADDIEDIDSVIVHVDPAIEKNEGSVGIK
ncbi:MAG: cation diffusion facilitator family transporter [Desulfobacterales bacterium]